MIRPEAYSNLEKVIKIMKSQGMEQSLIESVEMGRKALLALEMMAIAASSK